MTPLTIEMFKVPEYQLSKETKQLFIDLGKIYKKIDDDFLSLFEKRYILFIEDGTDLKGEFGNSESNNIFKLNSTDSK